MTLRHSLGMFNLQYPDVRTHLIDAGLEFGSLPPGLVETPMEESQQGVTQTVKDA